MTEDKIYHTITISKFVKRGFPVRADLISDVREFIANALENSYNDVLKMSDRELAEDLWLKAGVSQEDTIEQIMRAVVIVRRENANQKGLVR